MRLTNYIKSTKSYRLALIKLWVVAFGLFCSFSTIYAQGWEKYYGGAADDEGAAIIELRDHGYAFVGSSRSFNGSSEMYVVRTDVDGTILWESYIGSALAGIADYGNSIIEAVDGGFIVLGETDGGGTQGGRDIYMAKIDSLGEFVWENYYGGDDEDHGYNVKATSDGGYVIAGSKEILGNDDVYVIKTFANGNVEWEFNFGSQEDDEARDIVETADGGFIIVGSTEGSSSKDAYVIKINADQDILWTKIFGSNEGGDIMYSVIRTFDDHYVFTGRIGMQGDIYVQSIEDQGTEHIVDWTTVISVGGFDEGRTIRQTRDGGFIIAGTSEFNLDNPQVALIKLDNSGDEQWIQTHGKEGIIDFGLGVAQTVHNGFVVVGLTFQEGIFESSDVIFLKTDAEGNIFTNYVKGNVYYDYENNCVLDGDEEGVKGWVVRAVGDKTYYGTTDEDGNYYILVDTDQYEVSVSRPSDYWESCADSYTITFTEPYDSITRNFAMSQFKVCSDLDIDISAPYLQACQDTVLYRFTYCNDGTVKAENAFVDINFDEELEYVNSGCTVFSEEAGTVRFDVGTIEVGECQSCWIIFSVDCDVAVNQTHCVEAYITPDMICGPFPGWDGSSIAVDGFCDGDSVRFEIMNAGIASTSDVLEYIVVEDIVMGLTSPSPGAIDQLDPTEILQLAYPANGTTYRLIADQAEGHPGNSRPTIAVEGCVAGGGTDFATGFYNQFEEDDRDHFRNFDCQENIESDSLKPQMKRGYPKGYGDSLKIAADTDLKFHIKFQNTDIDSAIRVVIRDTLSPFLDPYSVRPGASSHDYTLEVYGEGILKFTFDNIMLVDSGTNFSASNGFVKYRISQRPGNSIGTKIQSEGAAIYFDYDAPPSTNETCHLVAGEMAEEFIIVNTGQVFLPDVSIEVYPNPFTDYTIFNIEGLQSNQLFFNIFDLSGRLIRSEQYDSTRFKFYRENLSAGMYVYKIETSKQLVSTGKIMVQ